MGKHLRKAALFFMLAYTGALVGKSPLLSIGGGYFDAGENHSGDLYQIEYKFGNFCFYCVRPQLALITPGFQSVFVGLGLGVELYSFKHVVLSPSFSPGVYFNGDGKDLGHPIEFRSAFELAYEWSSGVRLGGQFYHLSNAHLSNRNPGANAVVLFVAIPLN